MYEAYHVYNIIHDTLKYLYAFIDFISTSNQLNA